MKLAARLLAATAITAFAVPALAADIVIVPPPAPLAPIEDPAFVGPYWGVYGGIGNINFRIATTGPMAGTQFGYNFGGSGNLRFGIEVETEYYRVAPALVDATLNGRVGLVIGNNNILLYGQAGIGTLPIGLATWSAGGGIEFLLANDLALFAEGKVFFPLGGGVGIAGWSVRGGVNYYADHDNLDAAGDFDWAGLYLGAFGGAGDYGGGLLGVGGVQVGYNFGNGNLIGGVEVETAHLIPIGGAFVQAMLNGRAGFTFGNVLLYGEAGIGTLTPATPIWSAGGGVELALGDRLGLAVEGKALFLLGGGGFFGWQATGGVNVHFGR